MNKHEKAFILKKTTENQRKKQLTLESSKTLRRHRRNTMLIGTLPVSTYTFGVLGLIGVILVLIALNGLANYLQGKRHIH